VQTYCQRSRADYLQLVNGDDLGKLLALHFIRRVMQGGR